MARVKDIRDYIDSIAPFSTQCEWDNCGLLVGDTDREVMKVGLALDLTPESLGDAVKLGADLIVTHHPVIFTAQKSFLKGNMAYEAAVREISVISAHTCYDCAEGGVNDVLCELLGITDITGVDSGDCAVPMARLGFVPETDTDTFARLVGERLRTVCRVIGENKKVSKVAVCGGAGMSFYDDVVRYGADIYVTGDISHHDMLRAVETGVPVVAAGHFETENPSILALMSTLQNKFPECEFALLSATNPVRFI